MALSDLNAHFAISENYEDLVLIRVNENEGSNILRPFLKLYSKNL